LTPPSPKRSGAKSRADPAPPEDALDWDGSIVAPPRESAVADPDNAGIRREPELPEHEAIAPESHKPAHEFELAEDEPDDDAQRLRAMQRQVRTIARQVALDPGDGMELQ
jgi:type IV secretion system protein VirD4